MSLNAVGPEARGAYDYSQGAKDNSVYNKTDEDGRLYRQGYRMAMLADPASEEVKPSTETTPEPVKAQPLEPTPPLAELTPAANSTPAQLEMFA